MRSALLPQAVISPLPEPCPFTLGRLGPSKSHGRARISVGGDDAGYIKRCDSLGRDVNLPHVSSKFATRFLFVLV